jgi:hypothetical protein
MPVPVPDLAVVNRVEIFEAGVHKGRPYTVWMLDQAVANFARFSGAAGAAIGIKVDPPVVLGHSEDQALLDDSGLPAAGIVTRMWRDRSKLIADFGDVPGPVAGLINQRAYRTVSAEFWLDFEDQGRHFGLTLKRVAILGGEVPQVKSLADIPRAVFVDRFADRGRTSHRRLARRRPVRLARGRERPTQHGTVVCFSDLVDSGAAARGAIRLLRPVIRLRGNGR